MQPVSSLKVLAIAVGLTIAAGAALAQTSSKSVSAFEQELVNVEMRFIAALQQKDMAYVEQVVAADFSGVALNGDSMERSDFMDDLHDGLSKDTRIYEVRVVRMDETCAVVSYSEILPGEKIRYRHLSDTWVKEGDEWKLKFQHRTPRMWSALDLD